MNKKELEKLKFYNILGIKPNVSVEELEYGYHNYVRYANEAFSKIKNPEIKRNILQNLMYINNMLKVVTNDMLQEAEYTDIDAFIRVLNKNQSVESYDFSSYTTEKDQEDLTPEFMRRKEVKKEVKEEVKESVKEDEQEDILPDFLKNRPMEERYSFRKPTQEDKKRQKIISEIDEEPKQEEIKEEVKEEIKEEKVVDDSQFEVKYEFETDDEENLTSHLKDAPLKRLSIDKNVFRNLKNYIARRPGLVIYIAAGTLVLSGLFYLGKNSSYTEPKEITSIETIATEPIIETTEVEEMLEDADDVVVLNNEHVVKYGEKLSDYSEKSNTKLSTIKKVNDIILADNIDAFDTITIPYYVTKRDLKYYKRVEKYDVNKSIIDYAIDNETDIDTLLLLNPNSIIETNGGYECISDEIVLPNFISHDEYNKLKAEDAMKKYTK